jgi:hypothetical protein
MSIVMTMILQPKFPFHVQYAGLALLPAAAAGLVRDGRLNSCSAFSKSLVIFHGGAAVI